MAPKNENRHRELSDVIRDHMVTNADLTEQLKTQIDLLRTRSLSTPRVSTTTRGLTTIGNDVKINLGKRLGLEIRVAKPFDGSNWHVLPVPGIAAFRQLLEVHLPCLHGRQTGRS